MGSCAAPSAKGDDKFITTDYLQQCPKMSSERTLAVQAALMQQPDKSLALLAWTLC
ncbi:TPA: hypothetical protein IG123_004967, partial [Escherichia coli]|nr:hypothetical protein [Escherichia coli]